MSKEYSWQQNELGEYSYKLTVKKKSPPSWLVGAISAVVVCVVSLGVYTKVVLPNMRPTTVISYSGQKAPEDGSVDGQQEQTPEVTGFEGMGERLDNSIVTVEATSPGGGFFGQSTYSATGMVVSADGYILSDNSFATGNNVMVYFSDGNEYPAEVIGSDARTDCTVLKIDKTDLTPVEFGDSSTVLSGTRVASIGRILNEQLGTTLSLGAICGVNNSVTLQNGQTVNLLQTDAVPESNDNAGSALLDSSGRVIGMVTTMISTNTGSISLAIPSNDIVQVLESIINVGVAPSGLVIGILGQDADYGVVVEAVNEGSPAEKGGLKVGDLIMKVDGTAVKSVSEINKIRDTHSAGDKMVFGIYREGETMDIEITLE